MKDLSKRFFSGLIGLVLLIFIVSKGGYLLSFAVYIVSIIGLREFYKAIEEIDINPISTVGYLGTTGLFINTILQNNYLGLFFSSIIITLLILLMVNKDITIEDISATILGIIYIPFLLFHITYLDKTKYIWLVFIIAFGTDTFAYISGNLFGKRKLCPKISPKKTIEGSIGGIVGTIILLIIYSIYFELSPIWKIILLSIFCSIIAQLGDLVASKIKRVCGIKDYGFIMPGHGGVLDRFDSIIFTAPVIYYYISMFLI
ncbi:phosphatidate cytidylyltransferase [Tissierella praeacuta DSM 18095]|uniref:Phosphatidate cytidylyltransferase n=1 Tax=Tissierella praeacuta DSM 18095 TaxID=1123404 RepID=A0A1M4SJB5_9FIRM|nr:phosphatidate cytidylyltransferase [Tissierella praeacuta]SHE32279.1 phosphatidate cytidylyltransferase [Tissierella praeacuta DSM 18095]SUP01483.1 Phosphatidate cytidylyltransferase [Tissierella praeacuta]